MNCICGQDLRRVLAKSVGASVAAAHQACISLLEGERTTSELGFPAELPTTDLLHSMLQLGEFDMELVGAPQPTHMIREAGIVADLLGAGYRCLVPWPYAFRDLLCRLAERSLWRPGRFGMRKAFGQATVWFSRLEQTSRIGSLVGAEVERYLGNQVVVEPTRIRIGHLAQDARVITLTDAAHRLGCTRSKLKEVLLRAEVALDTSGPGRPALVRLEDVLAVQAKQVDLLGEREAAQELGIGRVSVQAALRALGVEPDTGPASVLRPGLAWSKKALHRAIQDRLPTSPSIPSMASMRFGAALGRLVRAGYSRERACEYLLRDGVSPVGKDCQGRGVGGFLFAEEDLDRLCPTGRGYSITEAGRRIGANSELVHLLVNRGLLAADATPQGRHVRETAIQAFRQTYVLPGQLNLEVGRHRGWAASQLVSLGCRPVLGPGNGSRQIVFLASEVKAVRHKIR
ncbi:hypothetical protein [Muricoccus vinaceus]|uniref:Uncharacterized protein n=1 Tax=Muricoccus vinaceus TaxID=424704 RepID=A0ABV6IVS6_9PROT